MTEIKLDRSFIAFYAEKTNEEIQELKNKSMMRIACMDYVLSNRTDKSVNP